MFRWNASAIFKMMFIICILYTVRVTGNSRPCIFCPFTLSNNFALSWISPYTVCYLLWFSEEFMFWVKTFKKVSAIFMLRLACCLYLLISLVTDCYQHYLCLVSGIEWFWLSLYTYSVYDLYAKVGLLLNILIVTEWSLLWYSVLMGTWWRQTYCIEWLCRLTGMLYIQ